MSGRPEPTLACLILLKHRIVAVGLHRVAGRVRMIQPDETTDLISRVCHALDLEPCSQEAPWGATVFD